MKYKIIAASIRIWYALRVDWLIWLSSKIAPETPACTRIETYGVFHRGCIFPNAAGKYRSIPTTNGTRAIPATVLPTPPAFPTDTNNAASTPTNPTRSAVDPTVIAANTPLLGSICAAGISDNTANVPAMYIAAMRTPEPG